MTSTATTVEAYLKELPDNRKEAIGKLRDVILTNLPSGFSEQMSYGMIGYVVPHSLYPHGYHCNPTLPLPFLNLASQKNYVSLYHMGLYADAVLMKWFESEMATQNIPQPEMGKSCLKFKKPEQIPYALIGQLVAKISVNDWIARYESVMIKK